MLVKNVHTGKTAHVPNSDTTIHSLIRLGLLEIVQHEAGDLIKTCNGSVMPQMAPAPTPKWDVSMVRAGSLPEAFPAIVFTVGTTNYERFAGEPEEAHTAFGKRMVPPAVLKAYAALYKQHYAKRK
jgi:hypothetical protein